MRLRAKVRYPWAVGVAALLTGVCVPACSESSFQPIAFDAKAWIPPAGWNPEPACVSGYYVAINGDSCGCSEPLAYALCVGSAFTQCACGSAFSPGATCPQGLSCDTNDFPPQGYTEFTDYAGPGWAGLTKDGG